MKDPMLSDEPQKQKDRSKLANPEPSDKVNKKSKIHVRSKSYKKRLGFFRSTAVVLSIFANRRRRYLSICYTTTYYAKQTKYRGLSIGINRISAQLLTKLCKDSKLPQTCGKKFEVT